jgi:TonB family protein
VIRVDAGHPEGSDGREVRRVARSTGRMGTQRSVRTDRVQALRGPQDNPDPHLARMLAEEQAGQQGVLGILGGEEGSHLSSIFGRDSALGNDAENVLGGLVGTQIGEAYGVGGLGLVGTGRGGGGSAEGTLGLGELGTIGHSGGTGSSGGYGWGVGGIAGRRAHGPGDLIPGTAWVRGSLDKDVIRRIIRRHLNEVRFCYERQLPLHPDLYGRVVIKMTIAGTGQVVASSVDQSTLADPSVGECAAAAARRWEFPAAAGGGVNIVNYPFVFRNSEG